MAKPLEKDAFEVFEKRETPREKVIESVCFSHFNEDGSLNLEGKGLAVDFSPMGMQIQVKEKLPVNTKILIEVFFPKEIHKYTGEIAWGNEIKRGLFAIGIRILFKKVVYRKKK